MESLHIKIVVERNIAEDINCNAKSISERVLDQLTQSCIEKVLRRKT